MRAFLLMFLIAGVAITLAVALRPEGKALGDQIDFLTDRQLCVVTYRHPNFWVPVQKYYPQSVRLTGYTYELLTKSFGKVSLPAQYTQVENCRIYY